MAVCKTAYTENEYELFSEYRRTGDKEVRDKLVNNYIYIAEILSRKFINRGIEYDDIFQVACMGVFYAVERFDPDRGVMFATFATPTILGEIRRYFRDRGNFIKVPRRLYEVFYRAESIRRLQDGDNLTPDKIARALNLPQDTVEAAYRLGDSAFIKSLEYEACADGSLSLSEVLGMDDDSFLMIENHDFIDYCKSVLSQKECDFISMRYYKELSQQQIADKWNVSQMYISRFEKKVLRKLKQLYFKD